MRLFERHGVKFISLRDNIDTSGPVGRFMLALIQRLVASGELSDYAPLHIAHADLFWRAGCVAEARAAYAEALAHTYNDAERAFLRRRLAQLH